MKDWDYEDDGESQQAIDRCCIQIRQANDLLNEAHKEMTDSLHDTAKRIILSELQVTDDITNDIRNTYFRYHHVKKLACVMPEKSEFPSSSDNTESTTKGEKK